MATIVCVPLENLSGDLHLGVTMEYSVFPLGRIGQLSGISPVEGSAVTNGTTGILTITGVSAGTGVLMTRIPGASADLDNVHYQEYSAT